MNREILLIAGQLKEAYEGEPWFGRSIKETINEMDDAVVFERPNGQHSILELLWHMITWKEFTISRLRKGHGQSLGDLEKNDWRELDHTDRTLWQKGLERFASSHDELVGIIRQQEDDLLFQKVEERNYSFSKLLYGVIQHDIYHLGQMAYIKKLLQK